MRTDRAAVLEAVLALACLLGAPPLALAQSESPDAPEYRPPMRGAPASRVGGATRGASDARPLLAVIAPDHTGLTLREQPDLWWYVSQPLAARLEITVINDDAVQPLVELTAQSVGSPGLQRIRLAEQGVKLKPNVEYRWFVGLVVDPKQRSSDIIASGTIQYLTAAPGALGERLKTARAEERYRVLAEGGVWYDAIDALIEQMRARPGDAALRKHLGELLKQVGIAEQVRASILK